MIDIGGGKQRYCSDMTRTYFCKQADPKYAAIHDLVRRANEAAEALVKPGVKLSELDARRPQPDRRRRLRRILHPPAGPFHRPDRPRAGRREQRKPAGGPRRG